MERFTISKSEKQTIYEIYRACRLCGAGGGYRMPIIQNIIDLDNSEVELRKKIQECLQLEVRPDDRMPPLICELCVDKLNDFYDFLELTRQTNIKTRTRLGLPIETAKKGETESNDCILGVTEPIYDKEDEAAKRSKAGPKSKKIKKEPEVVKVKTETASDSSRSSSVSSRTDLSTRPAPSPRTRRSLPAPASAPAPAPAPAPARRRPERERSRTEKAPETPRHTEGLKEKKGQLSKLHLLETPKEKKGQTAMRKELQTLLEDSIKFDDQSLLMPRTLKRTREEPPRPALLPKRAKAAPQREPVKQIINEPVKEPSPVRTRPGPKSRKPVRHEPDPENIPVPLKVPRAKKPETPAKAKEQPKPQPEPSPPAGPPYKCMVCDVQIKAAGAFTNHMRSHVPCFTKLTNACNPCGAWFVSGDEAAAHHRHHRAATFPYHCRRCFDDFRTLQLYDEHIDKGLCVQDEPPQVKCEECWAVFAGEQARAAHRCPGRSGRPGGKCSKCSRAYATVKTLKRHESQCVQRKTGDLIADPDVLRRLKPMRVRITRCDGLLRRARGDHYDVSTVKPNYGLAKNYIYPYMKLPPKTEPKRDKTVAIPVALKEELATDYTHWDSDDSDCGIIRKVPSLSTLAIKKLFSKNVLGKVPRKRKKNYEAFENDDFNDVSHDINDIINSLGDDLGNGNVDRNAWTAKIKDIIGCLDDTDVNEDAYDDKRDEVKQVADERQEDDKVCNDTENDEGTKEKLIESNERVDNDNCEESSNVETRVGEEASNGEMKGSEETSCVDTTLSEERSNVEASVSEEPGNIETRVEEPSNGEMKGSEDTSRVNTTLSEERSNVAVNVNEEPTNGEVNCNKETSCVDTVSEETGNAEGKGSVDMRVSEPSNTVIENHTSNLDDDNEKVNTIDMEINHDSYKDKEINLSSQNIEDENKTALEPENVSVNGINHETSMEVDNIDSNESKTDNKQTKESPIKHSIENLIGDTDRNPDKYIKEVISSIEDIIMNNSRTDENCQENDVNDRNLMDALDEQIGEKRISDNDKITLEDLLPKENRHEDLENISDDDFNFDA